MNGTGSSSPVATPRRLPTPKSSGAPSGCSPRRGRARTGAAPGDRLLLAGQVGGFLGAYLLLTRTTGAAPAQRAAWIDYLARPVSRWKEAAHVNRSIEAHASIDTSDGLFDGFLELTRGQLGLRIDLDVVPFHPFAVRCAEQLGLPLDHFLFGDGDWNILFAVAPDAVSRLALDAEDAGTLRVIGEFTEERRFVAQRDGVLCSFTGPRNEHFRSRLEDGRSFADKVIGGTWFQLLPSARRLSGSEEGEEVLSEHGVR